MKRELKREIEQIDSFWRDNASLVEDLVANISERGLLLLLEFIVQQQLKVVR